MSKFFLAKYKDRDCEPSEEQLCAMLDALITEGFTADTIIFNSEKAEGLIVGALNPIRTFEDVGLISLGASLIDGTDGNLPDGSYAEIQYDADKISFYCDRFESKTLWYYADSEKLFVSNSQRVIMALKQSFHLNLTAVSWFLSSGSMGPDQAWDSEIRKVKHGIFYQFYYDEFLVKMEKRSYTVKQFTTSKSGDAMERNFMDLTTQYFEKYKVSGFQKKCILPLSGGNDSRLLLEISRRTEGLESLPLINWGMKSCPGVFDDKTAAKAIAKSYVRDLSDEVIPKTLDRPGEFLDLYIALTECRVDHFNAFSDHFQLFKNFQKNGLGVLIRGDIPFTEGIDLNDKMARMHVGIPIFDDYVNANTYDLEKWRRIQLGDLPKIQRVPGESLIQWRDRLYTDFRIPIVISAFTDMLGCFAEVATPMMSLSHYRLYENQLDSQKGDKAHIVKLSAKLDTTKIPFNARPSIPAMSDLFNTPENIQFLRIELTKLTLFSPQLVQQVSSKLIYKEAPQKEGKINANVKTFIEPFLPRKLKALVKSKRALILEPVVLAYRMILIEKINKSYLADSKLLHEIS